MSKKFIQKDRFLSILNVWDIDLVGGEMRVFDIFI